MQELIDKTKATISCWVDSWGVDGVYVAYSGGKDSEVLAHIVRSIYPEIPLVFSNTGLEYPEIVKHVRYHENVTEIRPELPFHKVVEKYGWPVVSKTASMAVSRYRNTKREDQRQYRLHGKVIDNKKYTSGTIPKKWQFLCDAPFKISEQCCNHLKKKPFLKYEKETGRKPMIGIMKSDSELRRRDISRRGCNVYDAKHPQSRPLAQWTEEDVYIYIKKNDVKICDIYRKGYDRTGCMFCMFGLNQEVKHTGSNRFQKMQKTHPKHYYYCINKLGAGEVLDFLEVDYK